VRQSASAAARRSVAVHGGVGGMTSTSPVRERRGQLGTGSITPSTDRTGILNRIQSQALAVLQAMTRKLRALLVDQNCAHWRHSGRSSGAIWSRRATAPCRR